MIDEGIKINLCFKENLEFSPYYFALMSKKDYKPNMTSQSHAGNICLHSKNVCNIMEWQAYFHPFIFFCKNVCDYL